MKNLFTAILLLTSIASFAQSDISNINIKQTGYKSSYEVGDTIILYFQEYVSSTDYDSVIVQWNSNGTIKYYRMNLKNCYNPIDTDYPYVTKFIVPETFLSGSRINIGVGSTPKILVDGLAAVISQSDLDLKNIAINVYTTSGQFLKTTTSNAYKETLTHGVYLFSSVDTKVIYSGKILVNQ
jgi:hypothetical protein